MPEQAESVKARRTPEPVGILSLRGKPPALAGEGRGQIGPFRSVNRGVRRVSVASEHSGVFFARYID